MFDIHPSLSVLFTHFLRRSSFLLPPVTDSLYTIIARGKTVGGGPFSIFLPFFSTFFTAALFFTGSFGSVGTWNAG